MRAGIRDLWHGWKCGSDRTLCPNMGSPEPRGWQRFRASGLESKESFQEVSSTKAAYVLGQPALSLHLCSGSRLILL